MAQSREVTQAEREASYAIVCQRLQAVGERWLTARAAGRVPPALDAEIDEAMALVRREGRKLTNTIRRLSR